VRTFSATASIPADAESQINQEEKRKVSNAFKNQHIRFIPKKKLNFNILSPDGKLALVYHGGDHLVARAQRWKYTLAAGIPMSAGMFFALGPASPFWFAYPACFLPFLYEARRALNLNIMFKGRVEKIWMYQNGDQLLL